MLIQFNFVTNTKANQWTTRTLLEWMTSRFQENEIESPRLISEMLLTHVIGGERIDLYANVERNATEEERDALRSYVKRTLEHEPVQYIVGKAWFNGMEFLVNSSTLIPRSCTETIVEQCVQHCNSHSEITTPRIAEIGTGSGCIAIAISANAGHCAIVASDISNDALELAKENAMEHGVNQNISFVLGDCFEPFQTLGSFDIICSNPPYIPDDEMVKLDANVKNWEPKLALSGGKNGLFVLEPLIRNAHKYLNQAGVLLVEIATNTRTEALKLANESPELTEAKILRDRFGDDRFLRAIKSST